MWTVAGTRPQIDRVHPLLILKVPTKFQSNLVIPFELDRLDVCAGDTFMINWMWTVAGTRPQIDRVHPLLIPKVPTKFQLELERLQEIYAADADRSQNQ